MRKSPPVSWFNPEELQTLKGMSWLARKVAHDVLSGLHTGRFLGQGTDFSQYRSYQPGDDLRRVDWTLYGRTDKLYLKESELESRTSWYGILDRSASMAYEEGNISKWQYAKILWAAIASLVHQQGDSEGVIMINDEKIMHYPPNAAAEPGRMLALFEAETSGRWPARAMLPLQSGFSHKYIIITDLYEHSEELGAFIKSLVPLKNEVCVFHLMGQQEMILDFKGFTLFQDAETGQIVETDSSRIRSDYKEKAAAFLQESRNKILTWGAKYYLFTIPLSPVPILKQYLSTKPRRAYVANR